MRDRIYNPAVRHSNAYYRSVLNQLIIGNRDNLTYLQIAANLNDLEIATPAGLTWTADNAKGTLRKLRLWREFPSKMHYALLELIFTNELQFKDTLPLFRPRLSGTM